MSDADEVKAEVRERVESGGFIASLVDRIGANFQASAVFGQAVERGPVTVIPVARASWGFGGGSGGGEDGQEGAGGGGGGSIKPIGFIEVGESGAKFRQIRDPRLVAAVIAASIGLLALVSLRLPYRGRQGGSGRARKRCRRGG